MITRNYQTEELILNKNGLKASRLYDNPEGEIIHIEIEAGKTLQSHSTPVNVAFYVIEGELKIEIGEEKKACPADTLIESPKDIPHAIHNESDISARILVIKMPKPQKRR
jgi:quercetin dioxygenase-like cupin family protein